MRRPSPSPNRRTARQRLLREALRCGGVAPRLLYETPAQALKWLAVHRRWSPAIAARGRRFYRAALEEIARAFPGATRVVSLGCGNGAKDLLLLRALRRLEGRVEYVPCDAGAELVARAASLCRKEAEGGCRPMVADLARVRILARRLAALPPSDGQRIVLFLGMLPSLEPTDARRILQAILHPGDALVVSANLLPPGTCAARRVMAQYDNRETRAWLLELPRALGWPSHAKALRFRWGRDPEWRGLRRIEGRYRAEGAPRLLLFASRRHTPTRLRAFLRTLDVRTTGLRLTEGRDEGIAWGIAACGVHSSGSGASGRR